MTTAVATLASSQFPGPRRAEVAPRPSPTLQSVVFDLPDRWGRHPGYGLTPPRIIQIYRSAEYGYPQAQCDLFDDIIERDGHLRSQIEMLVQGVAGKPWIVQPGGDDPADIDAAAALEDCLRRVPNMRATIEHLVMAHAFGWSASEILWDETIGPHGKLFAPVWFENVAHRRFIFGADGQPRLLLDGNYDGVPLDPNRWIFAHRRHRSIPMAGLMRTATWWSLWKSLSVRDFVLFLERYAQPTPVATYSDATPDAEKAVLIDVVKNLGRDSYGVFHETCNVKSLDISAPSTQETFGAQIGICNAEISKLWTGATLTSGEGTSTGSYSLGQVHENMQYRVTVGEAERMGDIWQQQIGEPFVRWNNLKARAPRLKVQVSQHQDIMQRLDMFARLGNELGVPIDADQLRTEMQIKAPTGEVFTGTKTSGGGAPPPADPQPTTPPSAGPVAQ